eukprot:m.105567 g.105567  ORF g.105567 m.105567 type:complete len:89 (+) comp27659_c0_seq1:59-325(+)
MVTPMLVQNLSTQSTSLTYYASTTTGTSVYQSLMDKKIGIATRKPPIQKLSGAYTRMCHEARYRSTWTRFIYAALKMSISHMGRNDSG